MSNLGTKQRELIAHPSILTLASRIEAIYREMDRDESLGSPNVVRSNPGRSDLGRSDPGHARAGFDQAGPDQAGPDRDAQIEEIQARIEAMPANDLAEAMIHAMLATARIEHLRTCLNEAQAAQLVPAEKLTRSVLQVLIREIDLDLAPFGGKRYLPDLAAPTARDSRPGRLEQDSRSR